MDCKDAVDDPLESCLRTPPRSVIGRLLVVAPLLLLDKLDRSPLNSPVSYAHQHRSAYAMQVTARQRHNLTES